MPLPRSYSFYRLVDPSENAHTDGTDVASGGRYSLFLTETEYAEDNDDPHTAELVKRKGGGGGHGGGGGRSGGTGGSSRGVSGRVSGGNFGKGGNSRPRGPNREDGSQSSVRGGGGAPAAQTRTTVDRPQSFVNLFGALALTGIGGAAIVAGTIDDGDGNDSHAPLEFCQGAQQLSDLSNCTKSMNGTSTNDFIQETQFLIPLTRGAPNSTKQIEYFTDYGARLGIIAKSHCSMSRELHDYAKGHHDWLKNPAGLLAADLGLENMCTDQYPGLQDLSTTSELRDKAIDRGKNIGEGLQALQKYGRADADVNGTKLSNYVSNFDQTVDWAATRPRSNFTDEESRANIVHKLEPYYSTFASLNKTGTDFEPKEKWVKAMNESIDGLRSGNDITASLYELKSANQILNPEQTSASSSLLPTVGWSAVAVLTAAQLAGIPSDVLSSFT